MRSPMDGEKIGVKPFSLVWRSMSWMRSRTVRLMLSNVWNTGKEEEDVFLVVFW